MEHIEQRESEESAVTPQLWAEYNRVFALYSQRLEKLLSKKWVGAYGVKDGSNSEPTP